MLRLSIISSIKIWDFIKSDSFYSGKIAGEGLVRLPLFCVIAGNNDCRLDICVYEKLFYIVAVVVCGK